jgi:histidinol-phosphatase (PHP family)
MLNFKTLLDNSSLYNFHSHTQFCDGHAEMRDFARRAVADGFTHYGFSPHSPINLPSTCNMSSDDVDAYLAEVDFIKHNFNGTRFYASMEIDYVSADWGPAIDYFQNLPLDYRIGSVHFIPAQDGTFVDIDGHYEHFAQKMRENFRDDIRYVVETFYAQSIAMLRAGGFDILGHFDKIGQNAAYHCADVEKQPWYEECVQALIAEIIKSGVTIEVNTKALAQHHRIFPGERFLPQLVKANVPIVVNSDAHYPDLINAGRDYALNLIAEIEKSVR